MAVKTRTIWLTDEEWARLKARAVREGVNVSNLIRKLTGDPPVRIDHFGSPRPAPKPGKR